MVIVTKIFRRPLWQLIMVAFVLGALFGAILGPQKSEPLRYIGDLYLNALRMVVVPLIFFTIALSISQLLTSGNAARLFARTIIWFLATSFIAAIVGIVVGKVALFGGGLATINASEFTQRELPSLLEVLVGIVPANPIKAMVDANIVQIMVFGSIVGAALGASSNKFPRMHEFLNEGAQLMFAITRYVLKLAPVGTFSLIGWVVGHYGLSSLLPLINFIGAIYIACLVQIVLYGVLIKFHGLPLKQFYRKLIPAQQMAFATSSSVATMPLSLAIATERLGVPQSYASFALPLGTTLKMDGCGAIYPVVAAIFVAQYFSVPLSISQYLLIVMVAVFGSLGTAGAPGTSLVMLTLVLSSAGLPLEGIGYIIAVDRIIDMMRTVTNVTGQIVVPLLVAKEEGFLNETLYNEAASESVITVQS